ncbi:MAG: nuclear transport factor 2 family protein [Acidimicrobiia bacterium]
MTPEDLIEIEAVKRLKYRYLRCLDQKRWDEIVDCFTPDAVADYSSGKYHFDGRDAIVGFLRDALGDTSALTSHRVHHPEIDLTSSTSAVGTFAMDDVVIFQESNLTVRGAAFYTDEFVKQGRGWLISRIGYRRTYEEMESRDRPGLTLTASWWDTGGQSDIDV